MNEEITNKRDGKLFQNSMQRNCFKFRVNLTDDEGYELEMPDGESILIDVDLDTLFASYQDWKIYMPSFTYIVKRAVSVLAHPDRFDDDDILDGFMDEVEGYLENSDVELREHRGILEVVEDILWNIYNYVIFAIADFRPFGNDFSLWEFILVEEAEESDSKLYMTCSIYDEALNDLYNDDTRTDVTYLEAINGLKDLQRRYASSGRRSKAVRDRDRDRGLLDGLVA